MSTVDYSNDIHIQYQWLEYIIMLLFDNFFSISNHIFCIILANSEKLCMVFPVFIFYILFLISSDEQKKKKEPYEGVAKWTPIIGGNVFLI